MSQLVGLPSELQGMIAQNLKHSDLNQLCLTCKTIKAIVLPHLYKEVAIKVPMRWSRLPSLEGLVGSTGDGLKHTTELLIDVQQDLLRDSQRGSEDRRSHEEVLAEEKLQFYLPQSSASNALNALIRLLIVKLPRDRLSQFHWYHPCELDHSTVNILFERQGASLSDFWCNRYSSYCNDLSPVIGDLLALSFDSMDPDHGGCRWAAEMIVENAKTLDHLHLGFAARITHDFALKRRPRYNDLSTSFAADVKEAISNSDLEPLIHLSLSSLFLCGLDLGSVIRGEIALDIDFNSIIELRLESCPGLIQAFSLLTGQEDSSKLALRALETLFVRLEEPATNFSTSLKSFLTSVRGLTDLRVLIDKTLAVQDLESILKIHGKTLDTLVWDERRGPRTQLDACTSLISAEFLNLRVISRNCPSLTTLGLPLDWEKISSSNEFLHEAIRRYIKRMPFLRSLNIRNLPQLSGSLAMPMKYYVKALTAMFVDIVNRKRESTLLKTVALGAPLYRDLFIGSNHVVHTAVSDLLRFRVYSIEYDYSSPSGLSPVLSEVSADESSTYETLQNDYWLG